MPYVDAVLCSRPSSPDVGLTHAPSRNCSLPHLRVYLSFHQCMIAVLSYFSLFSFSWYFCGPLHSVRAVVPFMHCTRVDISHCLIFQFRVEDLNCPPSNPCSQELLHGDNYFRLSLPISASLPSPPEAWQGLCKFLDYSEATLKMISWRSKFGLLQCHER